jgi:GTP 3',8-cyclase
MKSLPLLDSYGRLHTDLRISVTDRCNLRCVYCIEEDTTFRPRPEILSFEEILRVASIARALGVDSVRITGGEPLVRNGVVALVRQLAAIGFSDLSMTTNGHRLVRLRQAGLQRVNVSCDSLRPDRFAQIRRRGDLKVTLQRHPSLLRSLQPSSPHRRWFHTQLLVLRRRAVSPRRHASRRH